MNDKEFAEKFKDHPIWNRNEVHDQILREIEQIGKLSTQMARKLERRKKHGFELWSFELSDLLWSTDHILKHAEVLRELLLNNVNHHVSRGFEKRVDRIKRICMNHG